VRVSVVIPTYNRAQRIPAAIESVLGQDGSETEIVVVDDGSTDQTATVVRRFGERVRYVQQPNAGVGAARNTGIDHATGEFISFLDSDDRWQPFKLSMQLALFKARPDTGLVFSNFSIETHDGSMRPNGASLWAGREVDFPEMERLEVIQPSSPAVTWPTPTVDCWVGPMYRQLLTELPILTSSVVVRRSVLDHSTRYTERVALFEDWEFFARVARRAPIGYVESSTTINVGHCDPGRVSKCSSLDRAVSYRTLLERVWLADQEFLGQWDAEVMTAYNSALLTVAREALLAGRRDVARDALAARRQAGLDQRSIWAALLATCARLAGGRVLLRNILRGRTAIRLMVGSGRGFDGSVNPAA
jgi:hypothetical protein